MGVAEVEQVIRGVRRPRALRYPAAMKKTPRKLVLRRETLRALANMDLAHVVGGFDPGANQGPPAIDSGRVACTTFAAEIATTVCR